MLMKRTLSFLSHQIRQTTIFHILLNWEIYLISPIIPLISFLRKIMDRQLRGEQAKITTRGNEEVSSIEWEFIKMTEQEVDLIYRMHSLVGERWDLIAGRIPGRKAEEIERFWIMTHSEGFAQKRKKHNGKKF